MLGGLGVLGGLGGLGGLIPFERLGGLEVLGSCLGGLAFLTSLVRIT